MEKIKSYLNWQSIVAIGTIAVLSLWAYNKWIAPRLASAAAPTA